MVFIRFSTGFILQKYLRIPNLDKQLILATGLPFPPSSGGGHSGIFCALLSISENVRDQFPSMLSIKTFLLSL